MALPIKSTPVIKGASAARFLDIIEQNTQRVNVSEKAKADRKALVNSVLKKAKI